MSEPTNYVAGFLFSEDKKRVALVKKEKPDWQRGKLNAIGGKIETSDQSPLFAMVREFQEETGALVNDWRHFCDLRFRGGSIHFFVSFGDVEALRTMEAEEIQVHFVDQVGQLATIPNLRWLVPLALDKDRVAATVEDNS